MEDRKKCAVYARMARCDDPAEMDAQVDMLLKLAELKSLEVVEVYREVAPGNGDIEDRPVLDELLKEIAGGAYDAVVARDVSRFGRGNLPEMGMVFDTLEWSGTSVITPDREYLLSNAEDAELLGLYALATDFERPRFTTATSRKARSGQTVEKE